MPKTGRTSEVSGVLIYGHSANVLVSCDSCGMPRLRQIHRLGKRQRVVDAAKQLPGFVRIESVTSFTRAEWVGMFGKRLGIAGESDAS